MAHPLGIRFTRENVKPRDEREIADTALAVRSQLGLVEPYADVCWAIRRVASRLDPSLEIVQCPAELMGNAFAFVSTRLEAVCVSENVWYQASETGDVFARYILAHELGHLVLHAQHADTELAKLRNPSEYVLQARDLGSRRNAELQADLFAQHFLAPAYLVGARNDPQAVKLDFGLPLTMARQRFEETRYMRPRTIPPHIEKRIEDLAKRAGASRKGW